MTAINKTDRMEFEKKEDKYKRTVSGARKRLNVMMHKEDLWLRR